MRRPTANEPQSRNSGLGKPQIIPFFPLQEGGIFFKSKSLNRVWFLLLRSGTCTITEQSKPKRQQRTLIQR